MFKKRVLFLFFVIFSWNITSEVVISQGNSSILQKSYETNPEELFMEGLLIQDETSYPFVLYREKNSDDYFNLSIKQDNQSVRFKQTGEKSLSSGEKNILDTEIPLELLQYPLRSREYTVLERSNLYKFKELSSNKILVLHKDPVVPEEVDAEEPILNEEESEMESTDEDAESITPPTPQIVIIPDYEKLIITVSEMSHTIMEVQYYREKTDREPAYIYEAINIHFIEGYYTVTNCRLTDVKSETTIEFQYNQESVMYNKSDIPPKYRSMTTFYGVR